MSVAEARNPQAPSEAAAAAQAIMQGLERAWNSADGAAYGEPFSTAADFVTITGALHAGRDAIEAGHQQIFTTIYAGSTIRYQVLRVRQLGDLVALAHVRSELSAPGGPLAGDHESTITVVLLKNDGRWEITALHNTLVSE